MTTKPEDIPHGVKVAALEAACEILAPNDSDRIISKAQRIIIRAILAAKAEERNEIAGMVDVFADTADFSAMNVESEAQITAFRIEEGALRGTAAAIRKRGEG